jgi:hypothetical protein
MKYDMFFFVMILICDMHLTLPILTHKYLNPEDVCLLGCCVVNSRRD